MAYQLVQRVIFIGVIGLASLSLAQTTMPPRILEGQAAHRDATETCSVTYSSGTGETATQFCITANGNIGEFSIEGVELVAAPHQRSVRATAFATTLRASTTTTMPMKTAAIGFRRR